MTEIELKFQVPASRREAVAARRGRARRGGHGAAAAGRLLRHRRRARWPRPASRCACAARARAGCRRSRPAASDAHDAPGAQRRRGPAARQRRRRWTSALHDGTPAGERLAEVLAGRPDAALRLPVPHRHPAPARTLRVRGAVLELAFDAGRIVAGDAGAAGVRARDRAAAAVRRRRCWRPRGAGCSATACGWTRAARPSAATCWRAACRSRRRASRPAVAARARHARAEAARRAVLQACAQQVVANASQVASGDFARRARAPAARRPAAAAHGAAPVRGGCRADTAGRGAAAALFRSLGAARDRAAVGGPLRDAARAGAGRHRPGAGRARAAARPERRPGRGRARSAAAQALLLDLLAAAPAAEQRRRRCPTIRP